MPSAKLTSNKRFLVRISLITGSTLATIIGAQSLASLNSRNTDSSLPTVTNPAPTFTNQAVPTLTFDANAPIVHAAPSIAILRRPGQSNAQTANSEQPAGNQIVPPNPVVLAAPAPIIVQAPGETIVIPSAPAQNPAPNPQTGSSR